MSTVYQQKRPLPPDPEAAAKEAERIEILATNTSHQARVTAAQAQELANRQRELESEFANLQRMKTARGSMQAAYDGYCRVYQRIERLAGVLAAEYEREISIPVFDPPPLPGALNTRSVGVPKSPVELVTRPDGTKATVDTSQAYRETRGVGPSGKGIPRVIPGSAADHDWVDTAGVKKK